MGAAAGTMLVVVIVRPRVGDRRDEPAITSAHQNANET
jgi:hypothetical protein